MLLVSRSFVGLGLRDVLLQLRWVMLVIRLLDMELYLSMSEFSRSPLCSRQTKIQKPFGLCEAFIENTKH